MLRWRLVLGTGVIGLLVVLCWADHLSPLPGVVLLPLAVLISVLATGEWFGLAKAAAGNFPPSAIPSAWPVYAGNLAMLAAAWGPVLGNALAPGFSDAPGPAGPSYLPAAQTGVLLTLAAALILAMLEEIRRFEGPGCITVRLGMACLGLLYGGLLLSFLVLLRIGYGIAALASMILVVKMADTGAYTVGHLMGRHKLAPRLSPGKTIEGTIGGLLWGLAAAWAAFTWLNPALDAYQATSQAAACPWWGWTSYGLVLGLGGLGGDLAESLLKRDAGRKDSSRWMPGLGGILDLLDSLLWTAPVAYLWWHLGWVG